MPRISKKLIASAVGSLALVTAVACQQRTEPQPDPSTTTPAQEPNALRPTPGTSTPGTAAPGTMSPSTANPSASAPIDNSDTLPVRGTDPDMQGGGAGGAGGHAGHGGSAGHGGAKSPH
ncbi:MAG TPA: hypothetical protein VMG12_21160 [Polyangiaceae bacterium]|nr:hypothetical protein [Polyangiaceae bacterium]